MYLLNPLRRTLQSADWVPGHELKLPSYGSIVQLVRTPACHAGGQGFKSPLESPASMHIDVLLVQRGKPEIPLEKILHRIFSICPCSSVGQSDGLISHRSVVRSHPLAPTADAVFISFHVRSWGLRPKKHSPLYIAE